MLRISKKEPFIQDYFGMSDPGAGFEYPTLEVSWLKRYLSGCSVEKMEEQLTLGQRFLVVCKQHWMHSG